MRAIVAAIGDSITYSLGNVTFSQQWLYRALVRSDTITQGSFVQPSTQTTINNKLVGSAHHIYNLGVGWEKTATWLARFDADVRTFGPGVLFIPMGSVNDIVANDTTTEANVRTMVERALSWGMRPVLWTIGPFNALDAAGKARAGVVNAAGRALAAEYGLTVLEFAAALGSTDGTGTSAYLEADGLHPTAAGHQLMGDVVPTSLLDAGAGIVQAGVAPGSPVADWIVKADGSLLDLVTGLKAYVSAPLTVTPRTIGNGHMATFGTIYATLPTSRWNRDAGAVFMLRGDPPDTATRFAFSWQKAAGPYANLTVGAGTYGNPAGQFHNGTTLYAQFGPTKTAAGECVHSMKWAVGSTLLCHLNAIAGTASATVVAPAAVMADLAYVGRKHDASGQFAGSIGRITVYDAVPADVAGITTALTTGPKPLAQRQYVVTKGVTVWR